MSITRILPIIALVIGLGSSVTAALAADLPLKVTLLQNGKTVSAASNGEYQLAQEPFTIRVESGGRAPSIIATTNAAALQALKAASPPLTAFPGFGAASSPGLLLISDLPEQNPLELYPGWNDTFDRQHGDAQGPELKANYQAWHKELKTEPTIIAAGRQYVNFEPAAGGADEMAVQGLAGPVATGAPLYLLVFADSTVDKEQQIYNLEWTTLTVRFAPLAAGQPGKALR